MKDKKIKKFIEKEQPIKLNDLVKSLPDISVHTLKKDLQYMKTEQLIQSIGKNRGTVYIIREK